MPAVPVPGPSERPELLVVLRDNPILWALVATWPQVRLAKTRRDKVAEKWARCANRRTAEVEAAWDALFQNGICRRDGTVDPSAARYVKEQIARSLGLKRRPPS